MSLIPRIKSGKKPFVKRTYESCHNTKRTGSESMVDRIDADNCDLHGIAGHQQSERLAPAHSRRPRNQSRRSDMGADRRSRGSLRGSSVKRLVESRLRTEKLLHDLRRPVHAQLVPLRDSSEPWDFDFLPGAARDCRGRPCSIGAGHAGGYISASQTRSGFWALQYGYRVSSSTRANPGWVDNR